MFRDICIELNWTPISSSSQTAKSDRQLLLNEIIECRKIGHFDISLKLAQSGLVYYPNDTAILDNLARVYQKLNRNAEAIDVWKNILVDRESSPRFKKSALKFILKDDAAFTDFVISNSKQHTPIDPVLKKLLDLSIQKRRSRDYDESMEFLEYAWSDSFSHPALIDNFARIQFAKGFVFRALYCFQLLRTHSLNKSFVSAAENFIEQNQSQYLNQLNKDIIRICQEYEQLTPSRFVEIQSFMDFIDYRLELRRKSPHSSQLSLFNIALFNYIEKNNIVSQASYVMYFEACLSLNYICDADNFYRLNAHQFDQSSQLSAVNRLSYLKEVLFPSCLAEINNQLTNLANKRDVDCRLPDIESIYSYEDLDKKCISLMEKFSSKNPELTLEIFNQFKKAKFFSPPMYKISGAVNALLGRKDQAIADFHKYVSSVDGSVNVSELSLPYIRESSFILENNLKEKIYELLDRQDYLSASNLLVDHVLDRGFYSILKNPDLISLTFNHTTFDVQTKNSVKRELAEMYADINFFDNFIDHSESLIDNTD